MARFTKLLFLVLLRPSVLWPTDSDSKAQNNSTKFTEESNVSKSLPRTRRLPNQSETTQMINQSESAILHLNLTEPCTVSIHDGSQKEFSNLLSEKMTQFVDIYVTFTSSQEMYSGTSKTVVFPGRLVWLNNPIGTVTFSSLMLVPSQDYIDVISFGTLLVGRKEFKVLAKKQPMSCFEKFRNAHETFILRQLEIVFTKLTNSSLQETRGQIKCERSKSFFVCCNPKRRDAVKTFRNNEVCTTSKVFGLPELTTVDYMIVVFCFILSPLGLAKVLGFFQNQSDEWLYVPHNFILCKILSKFCYRGVFPRLLLLAIFVYDAYVSWLIKGNILILFLFCCFAVALIFSFSLSLGEPDNFPFEERFFERLVPTLDRSSFCSCFRSLIKYILNLVSLMWDSVVKFHNVVFQPSSNFSYCECIDRSIITYITHDFFFRLVGTLLLIFGTFLAFLSLILLLKYTILGLFLNHDYYFPYLSLSIMVVFYMCKCAQCICLEYSSLMIKVFNVCEEKNCDSNFWEYDHAFPRISTQVYEEVRGRVLPYRKSIFKLVVQIIFIVFFALLVFNGCSFLEDTYKISFNSKVVALFAGSTLPLILKICFWEQSDDEKAITDKGQSKEVETIVMNTCLNGQAGARV